MDGPRDYHAEWSRSDREREISYDTLYRNRLTDLREWTYGYGGKTGGRDSWGIWDGQEQTPVFKMGNQQELNCTAQGTVLNVMWQPGWEGRLGENGYIYIYMYVICMYVYGWVPLLSTWNYHNSVNWLYSNIQ